MWKRRAASSGASICGNQEGGRTVTEDDERKKLVKAAAQAVLALIEARKPGKPSKKEIEDVLRGYLVRAQTKQ
jgi:Xaa-Pro aminopeptidase